LQYIAIFQYFYCKFIILFYCYLLVHRSDIAIYCQYIACYLFYRYLRKVLIYLPLP
jgi:hypothetical protein